jgi:AcrR family transcriptional regulator
MGKKPDIRLKKLPKQKRSIETINAILEAGIYILKHSGPAGFTTHKVAEKAGVNVASFYQYFPNKESLLFYLTEMNWETSLTRLEPILKQRGPGNTKRLKDYIREFFLLEAAEADLRQALRIASVDLRDTKEFKALISKGDKLFKDFIENTVGTRKSDDPDFDYYFIATLITSFAERTTDERVTNSTLIRQADLLADMIIGHFKVR